MFTIKSIGVSRINGGAQAAGREGFIDNLFMGDIFQGHFVAEGADILRVFRITFPLQEFLNKFGRNIPATRKIYILVTKANSGATTRTAEGFSSQAATFPLAAPAIN
jgi:hypothetical protein